VYLIEISGSVKSFNDVLVEMCGPVFLVGPHEELECEVVNVSRSHDFIDNGLVVFKNFLLLKGKQCNCVY
jgi:hypothetical protein